MLPPSALDLCQVTSLLYGLTRVSGYSSLDTSSFSSLPAFPKLDLSSADALFIGLLSQHSLLFIHYPCFVYIAQCECFIRLGLMDKYIVLCVYVCDILSELPK